jgi:riboflavin synthase
VFTGLIQGIGTVRHQENNRLRVLCSAQTADIILSDLEIGDSVAVDGICLSAIEILPHGFSATASPETLRRSTLGRQRSGELQANLETSLRVGSKLGGHFVMGHVDGVGCLQASVPMADSWEMQFSAPPGLENEWNHYIARYIVPKGSIAVNGVSLTVADCDPQGSWFTVAVIPHTYRTTNLCLLQPGDWVNLEGDILGKYVEKFLQASPSNGAPEINSAFLAEHGFS